jgi:hypothetical protein
MPLRTGNFRRAVKWSKSLADAGMPAGFHFHDLRHTGNNIAAASGASTRELMHRMSHASMRAALIYQHATSERDREIAESMDKRITKGTKAGKSAKDSASKLAKAAGGKRAKRSKPTDATPGTGKAAKRDRGPRSDT